jgi:predicted nucleotidyltransferase
MQPTREIQRSIRDIARKNGISLVILFGSVAGDNPRPDSDVDIAVRFSDGIVGLRRTLDVQRELSGLFGGREVDLAVLNRADPLFMKKIAERCQVLYAEPGAAGAFFLLSFKRYHDHRKYLEMERRFAAEYVRRIAS